MGVGRVKVEKDSGSAVGFSDQEKLGEVAGVGADEPVVDFNGSVKLGVFANGDEQAIGAHGGVEVGVAFGAEG